MKTSLFALAFSALLGVSAHADTLSKAKEAGAVTMGVRDSSGALSRSPIFTRYSGVTDSAIVSGEACGVGSSSVSGLAFHTGGNWPSSYEGALLFTDPDGVIVEVRAA